MLTFRLSILTVEIDVDVKYAEAKLTDPVNKILRTPVDPNDPGPQPIQWTNNVAWRTAEIEFRSKFPDLGIPPALDPKGEKHFVTDFKYGIISATMTLTHERGKNSSFCSVVLFIENKMLFGMKKTGFQPLR